MKSDNKNGDLFLIRHIKQKPIIWNTSHPDYHDREKRERVFKELSKRTNLDPFFLKRRWITLRERYVKDLRCQALKNNTDSTYKYNQELSYLKKHVKLKIQSNNGPNQTEETLEFEITEDDLLNDDDSSGVLIEFDDETVKVDNEATVLKEKEKNGSIETKVNEPEITPVTLTTVEEPKINVIVAPSRISETTPQLTPVLETPTLTPQPPADPSVRNEDVIFGELIVSQLMKITDEAKKRSIKRSILDLFF